MYSGMPIPPDLLERIWFYVTFNCNLNCSYCVAERLPERVGMSMKLPAFRRLVEQADALGFRQVAITGGEPFLQPDIAEMIACATAAMDTIVLTNATLLTGEMVDVLSTANRDRLTLQVSLNDANPLVNDEWRGSGSWELALRGLERLLRAGYNVAVRATLDGPDEASLRMLREFLIGRGLADDQVYGVPVARVGRARHGIQLTRAKLWPEPTIIGDGLYWHPLDIAPDRVVVSPVDPLADALDALVRMFMEVKPVRSKQIR